MNSYGNIISYRYIYIIFIYINLNFLRLDYVGQTLQFSFGVLKLVSKFHIIPQTDKEKSVENWKRTDWLQRKAIVPYGEIVGD